MDLQARLQMMTLQIVPFIMAVVFHEVGHGLVARWWGDRTAQDAGRLTLNPIPHMDPFGTVLIPIITMVIGFPIMPGYAKPVPINPSRFRKYRPGLFSVALAGPATNFILAFLSALTFCLLGRFMPDTFFLAEPLLNMAMISVQINFMFALFNLMPLPPLDGGNMVRSVLNYNQEQKFMAIQPYTFFILMALLMTGGMNFLYGPISALTHLTLRAAGAIVGIPV